MDNLPRRSTFTMIKLGVILRCFSKTPEWIQKQVAELQETVTALLNIKIPSIAFDIRSIDLSIPLNPRFIDADCGQLARALQSVGGVWETMIQIRESQRDLFSGLVNETAARQLEEGCTHSLVLSSSCHSLLSDQNMTAMIAPFSEGAKATGLVLPDPTLGEFIRRGCITNTFTIWELIPFFAVGGMDLTLRNRYKDE